MPTIGHRFRIAETKLGIGLLQWIIFLGLSKSFLVDSVDQAAFGVLEAAILLWTFRNFWSMLRTQWPSNFWPAVIVLMYVSQFIALMSILDWSLAAVIAHGFVGGQHVYGLTKIDAFYFAVTTFSTVGYGDIHPADPAAKLAVAFQILIGLTLTVVLIGVFVSQLVSRLNSSPRPPK